MWKLSKSSLENREGVDLDLIRVNDRALEISPIDFGIPTHGGLRSFETQSNLYYRGLSKCDGVTNKSYHQSGKALDFYAFVDGKASWDEEHLATVAAAHLQAAAELGIKLEWGGLWKGFRDMPHIQLKRLS